MIEARLSAKGAQNNKELLKEIQETAISTYNEHVAQAIKLRDKLVKKLKAAGATDVQITWGKVGNLHLDPIRKRACLRLADKIEHEEMQMLASETIIAVTSKHLRRINSEQD